MATTTNFGWTTPDDTDLVKDGAAAIRTLGSAIDTSLVDLKGGTTGQVLEKASNTDLDFTWATPAAGGGITLLSTTNLTTGTTVSINSISQSYKNLIIMLQNVSLASDAWFYVKFRNDTTDLTVSVSGLRNSTAASGNNTQNYLDVGNGADWESTNTNNCWTINIYDYASTSQNKGIQYFGSFVDSAAARNECNFAGSIDSNLAIDSFQLVTNGTNFANGTVKIYGVN